MADNEQRRFKLPPRTSEVLLPDGSGVPLYRVHTAQGDVRFAGVDVVKAAELPDQNLIDYTLALQEDTNVNQAQRADVIANEIERLQAELYEIRQFGEDRFEENTVLVFDMKFANSDQVFTYAALKKDNVWFITGATDKQYWTWERLVGFWKNKVVSIHKASAWDEIMDRSDQKVQALEGDIVAKDVDLGPEEETPSNLYDPPKRKVQDAPQA